MGKYIVNCLIVLPLLFGAGMSKASQGQCTVLSSNYIYRPGCYYLIHDLRGSIQIKSDSVELDLNGKKLIDPSPGGENIGINIDNHKNVTIKNGIIEGFWYAIAGSGYDISIFGNLITKTKYIGISLSGGNISIYGNHLDDMDFSQPKGDVNFYLVGFNIRDSLGCKIYNNTISATVLPQKKLDYRLEYAAIILLSGSQNCRIYNNIFSNFQRPEFKSIGFWVGSSTKNSYIHDNLIVNFEYGIVGTRNSYQLRNNLVINVEKATFNKNMDIPDALSSI